MRRLVSTIDLPKTDWLKYRKKGITGTDAGAICGLNPYSSAFQIYQDKITDEIEEFDNESMRQGRDLEEYVARRFSEETGLKVRRANAIFQNEENPFMLADFDRLIVGQKAGLECKTVSPYSSDKWNDGNIPLHYQMQVQHYLAVSGFDCWYIAAVIFGREFLIRKIERDEELINYLIDIERGFWYNNVLAGIMPEPDGSDNCSEMIAKMYFKGQENKTIKLSGYKEILDRRADLDKLIKKMEKEKKEIDQKIKMEMQDATVALEAGYKISWSNFEQNKLDTKKLKEEKPDIYKEYCKSSTNRRFTVSHAA
ncbi:YqaJ viral recombinase family protein [Lachnospiraceae bacterium CLA-AA-H246]|uniref:YqaJ viral recombinase family protein n=1 Tax=Hominisplanchenecus faecis TaxID=2885351 RepID=A0ABS8EXI1_9FIRM|nr:YqaJ viral recombinase family protein [Hominisplanchenecus faecis]MCC2149871.1 YqaJ viral recombinase family protein [Hominisplanchenecus faecis]MCM0708907.1 YqaJ viral recombinase family protein [Faecalicatena sp. BF-R-105]